MSGWEQGNGRERPSSLWNRIRAVLGAGLLVWGRASEGTLLRLRHFKNLLLFYLNSLPPSLCLPEWHFRFGIKALGSVPHCAGRRGRGMLLLRPTGQGAWRMGPRGQAMAGLYGGADPPELTAKELNCDPALQVNLCVALGQGSTITWSFHAHGSSAKQAPKLAPFSR